MAKLVVVFCLFIFALAFSAQAVEIKFYQRIVLEQPKPKQGDVISPLGGVSALSYIPSENLIFLLSDDRGEKGEPRAYQYSLKLDAKNKVSLDFEKQIILKSPDKNVDYEGLAILPWGNFLVASEGDQNHKPRVPPGLMDFRRDGKYVRHYDLPKHWLPNLTGLLKKGVRNNRGLEGLAASPNGQKWIVSVESHLEAADKNSTEMAIFTMPEAWVIKLQNQFLYPIEAPAEAVMAHGVSEVLFKNEEKLWVMERHLSRDLNFTTKIFEVDVGAAEKAGKKPLEKKLIFDLGKAAVEEMKDKRGLLNFEGLSWGPSLANGERLLLVASDNNFLPLPTEIWVFSVKD
jgi:3-phytase